MEMGTVRFIGQHSRNFCKIISQLTGEKKNFTLYALTQKLRSCLLISSGNPFTSPNKTPMVDDHSFTAMHAMACFQTLITMHVIRTVIEHN